MDTTRTWQFPTALLMAGGVALTAALPLITGIPVAAQTSPQLAQLFRNPSQSVGLREGTAIPVTYDNAERLIIVPDETVELELVVTNDIVSSRGTVIIREGSRITGEMRPVSSVDNNDDDEDDDDDDNDATQFVASEIVLAGSDRPVPIEAVSNVLTETETISRRTNPDYIRGAAIGAAAAAILSEIFGSIDFLEVLGGAGIGVLGEVLLRRDREVEVFVIEPDEDLDLVLTEDFVLGTSSSSGSSPSPSPSSGSGRSIFR